MNFIIPLVIYDFDIMFSFGESDLQLYKKLVNGIPKKDLKDKTLWQMDKSCGVGRFVMFPNGASLIRMPNIPKSCKDHGTLQHEIFHVISAIMRRVGLKHTFNTEEAYAYLIGYITMEVYKKLNK